jgi:hypothetical protein
MKTCSTCRFLGASAEFRPAYREDEGDDEPSPSEHRRCARVIHGNDYGDRLERGAEHEPALVTDGSGYSARLIVLPTFGCTLHEEKS